jgi:hypothetical protein
VYHAIVSPTSQASTTELVKTTLGSMENNEAENQLALDAFNLAALDRAGSAAMFEVRVLRVVPGPLCRRSPCFSFS